MFSPVILAHGSLGPWDELIFLGVSAIFLTMMGISWVRSRTNPPLDPPADPSTADADTPDHYRLD